MKIGKFYVSRDAVMSPRFHAVLAEMEFVPLRVECLFLGDKFEYIGLSKFFDETDEHRSYLGVPYAHLVVNHSAMLNCLGI